MLRILMICSLVLCSLIYFGQACSLSTTTSPETSAKGNGGGYGGLTSQIGGTYDGRTSSATATLHFYLAGTPTGCSQYPTGLESLGPIVRGVLDIDDFNSYHRNSLCDSAASITRSDIKILDFDPGIALYQNEIYVHTKDDPPAVSAVYESKAYCTASTKVSSLDSGTAVLISKKDGLYYAQIAIGKVTSAKGQISVVSPFSVASTSSGGVTTYSATDFSLSVQSSLTALTTATLVATVDAQSLQVPLNCVKVD